MKKGFVLISIIALVVLASIVGIGYLGVQKFGSDGGLTVGGGITSLNGLTGDPQTFSVATGQNTTLVVTSSGTDHQLKLVDGINPSFLTINATSTTATSTFSFGLAVINSLGIGGTATTTILGNLATSTFPGGLSVAATTNGFTVGTNTLRAKFSFDGGVTGAENRVACSGAVTIDWSIQNKYICAMTANVTSVTFVGGNPGTTYRWTACQDTTGERKITGWATNVLFVTGDLANATATPGITTKASTCNIFSFDANYASSSLIFFGTLPLKSY